MGVQTSTSSSTYLAPGATRFIPTTAIQDIFIHEAFKGFEVRYYLAIVVEGEEDVVVVFPVRSPKLQALSADLARIFCLDERLLKRSGEVLATVCMNPKAKG